MDAQNINQTYDLLTLVLCDTRLKHMGQYYIGPCPFCGGRDRFNLKATTEGWRWFCRKCGGEKYHGAIDYIMRRDNIDFKRALESMGGNLQLAPRAQTIARDPDPGFLFPDLDWQRTAWEKVDEASERLLNGDGKRAGLSRRARLFICQGLVSD